MLKPKTTLWSIALFIMTVIGSSLFYLLYDFVSNDVEPNVRIFGTVQLFIICLFVIFLLLSMNKSKSNILFGVYITSWFLFIIQTAPAFFWFVFHGKIVAEIPPYDNGVTGHWLYGALHIAIIIWGILNLIGYRKLWGNSRLNGNSVK